MIRSEFLLQARLDDETCTRWIEARWLLPQGSGADVSFADIDLARAQLIRDLKEDLGVNDEGVAVVLDLVDQIHGVRQVVRRVLAALETQPDTVRQQILAELSRRKQSP